MHYFIITMFIACNQLTIYKISHCVVGVHTLDIIFPKNWRWMTSTSSERHGLAVAWICTSSPKGVFHSAMTVDGSEGSKLAGTVGASEPQTLWSIFWREGYHLGQPVALLESRKEACRALPVGDSLASWPDNAGKKLALKNSTKNTVFVLSCASLGLHHLPTWARVKAKVKICTTRTSVSVYHDVVYNIQMKTFYVITKRIVCHPISNARLCKTPCWHNAHNVTADEWLN